MYGGMCSGEYAKSLMTEVSVIVAAGFEVTYANTSNESLITRARNMLTHKFLVSDADYLLFIDADQSFRAQDILRMVASGKELIGAPVPMKSINWPAIKEAAVNGKENISDYSGVFNFNLLDNDEQQINPEVPFEVKYIGSGMMLIHRSVFDAIAPLVPVYKNNSSLESIKFGEDIIDYWNTSIDDDGILLSEDYNFCKLWRSTGGKTYLDLMAKVSHIGTYIFNGKVLEAL